MTMGVGGYTVVSRQSVGQSVGEMLSLKLLPQFSSHINEILLYMKAMTCICVCGSFYEDWPKGSIVTPYFSKFLFILISCDNTVISGL